MAVGCRSGGDAGSTVAAPQAPVASTAAPATAAVHRATPARPAVPPPSQAATAPTPAATVVSAKDEASATVASPPVEKGGAAAPPPPAAVAPAAKTDSVAASATGRDATVDTAPVAPKAPASSPAKATSKAPSTAKKVLIVGDSMAATDFGRALQRRLGAAKKLRVARRGKSSTGLARPDFFDWMAEAQRQITRHKPDLVVVIIGGNDGQDLIPPKKKKGRRVHWKKDKWKGAYAARVQAFAKLLMGEDRKVAWLELPAMDLRSFERKLGIIRDVQKKALAELGPRIRYVDTRDIFYDTKGRLKRKITAGGKRVALRQEDGIHFSLEGGQYFADRVMPSLLEAWSMTP